MKVITKKEWETSWDQMRAHAESGELKSGDIIPVTLKDGEEIELVVAHDKGGKCFFVMRDCLKDTYVMNASRTNAGGWAKTDMRAHLNRDVFAVLPDELKEIIVPTKIVQVLGGKRIECEDKLFLLSATQVFGNGWWSDVEPEDTQLDIFPTERSRVKECGDHGSWWYWLRSPASDSSSAFRNVGPTGTAGTGTATNSNGVWAGFCINP